MAKKYVLNFIYSLILVTVTALWCGYYNKAGMENFYSYINLPSLTPPNIVFPIVWVILYALMVISFFIIINIEDRGKTKFAIQLFVANCIFQIIWSFVFFYNAYFMVGFAVIVLLDFIIIMMIEYFYKLSKIAGILLVPYLLWLLFATYLNWAITDLNGAVYIF